MASIKISALGELELDRLSDADVFIVNDQDATTQKITFETLKNGLNRDARYFTGPVEFSNTVVFNGPLAGRNVYTKTETDAAIAAQLVPVQDDVAALTANQNALITLTGEAAGTQVILGGNFTTANMRTSGPYSIVGMGKQLDVGIHNANGLIAINTSSINNLDTRLTALDNTDPNNKGTVVTNVERITALELAVGLDGKNITDNETAIQENTDYIDNLATQIGSSKADVRIDAYLTGTYTSNAQTVISAIDLLDAKAVLLTQKDDDLTARVAQADIWTGENNAHITDMYTTLTVWLANWATANPAGSAAQLATDLSNEMLSLSVGSLSPRA